MISRLLYIAAILSVVGLAAWVAAGWISIKVAYVEYKRGYKAGGKHRFIRILKNNFMYSIAVGVICIASCKEFLRKAMDLTYVIGNNILNYNLAKSIEWVSITGLCMFLVFIIGFAWIAGLKLEGKYGKYTREQN